MNNGADSDCNTKASGPDVSALFKGDVVEGTDMKNYYTVVGDVALLIDSKGNQFQIDAEDLERVKVCTWFNDDHRGYIKGTIKGKSVSLHRYLLNYPDGIVDHINRDKHDNRKSNLRVCTMSQSNMNRGVEKNNRTGLKGVAFCPSRDRAKKYRAQITINGQRKRLGWYMTAEEAHEAYKKAEEKYFGEFAPIR